MFFAAFEKKWWKGSSSNENSKSMDGDQMDGGAVFNDHPDPNEKEIEDVAVNTSAPAWIEAEKQVAASDDTRDLDSSSEDDFDEEEEEVFTNTDNYEQVDPHAPPAFDFDESFEDSKDSRPTRHGSRVNSIKEFFNTEILYRYDILNQPDREAIKGTYRIEVSGAEAGTWSVSLDRDIEVKNDRNEAEVVLTLDGDDFLAIINGKINAQIALVSKRVKINGDSRKASLLQNILAPRVD